MKTRFAAEFPLLPYHSFCGGLTAQSIHLLPDATQEGCSLLSIRKEKWESENKLTFVWLILHWCVRTHWCHRWVKPLKWETDLFLSLFGSCVWNKNPHCGLFIMRDSSAWDKRCDKAYFETGAQYQYWKFKKKTLLSFILCFCSTSKCLNSSTWGFLDVFCDQGRSMCSLGWGRKCFIHLPSVSKDFPAALPFACKDIPVCEKKNFVKVKLKKLTDRNGTEIPNDGLTLPEFLHITCISHVGKGEFRVHTQSQHSSSKALLPHCFLSIWNYRHFKNVSSLSWSQVWRAKNSSP